MNFRLIKIQINLLQHVILNSMSGKEKQRINLIYLDEAKEDFKVGLEVRSPQIAFFGCVGNSRWGRKINWAFKEVERLEKSFTSDTNWRCHFIVSTSILSQKHFLSIPRSFLEGNQERKKTFCRRRSKVIFVSFL